MNIAVDCETRLCIANSVLQLAHHDWSPYGKHGSYSINKLPLIYLSSCDKSRKRSKRASFQVLISSIGCSFRRRLILWISYIRSSHYACDMANTDHTFLTTVADNMRQYTKREVEQAKTARELMARLGYPSSQVMIDMLDASASNCAVVMLTPSSDHLSLRWEARPTRKHTLQRHLYCCLVSLKCSRYWLWICSTLSKCNSSFISTCHLDLLCVLRRRKKPLLSSLQASDRSSIQP